MRQSAVNTARNPSRIKQLNVYYIHGLLTMDEAITLTNLIVWGLR